MLKKLSITFPLGFELLIWLFYVCVYKYSYYLDMAHLPRIPDSSFPYLQICLYGICSSLWLIPYYRLLVPRLLFGKKYWSLFGITLVLFVVVSPLNTIGWARVFALFTKGLTVHSFFSGGLLLLLPDLNLMLTDLLAFFCIAFARFSYQNEKLRHQMETDNLQLQLGMLKAQLQPHFLFNTLNGLYGMSLTGSKDTPRFILLLSQMMQYILYDCDSETVNLNDELTFLKGYFELEQKKFPNAAIVFEVPPVIPDINMPPLLFLPLVENSFKHGKHKIADSATVRASLFFTDNQLNFTIQNDTFDAPAQRTGSGGIGLINIKKRLELYYPDRYTLTLQQTGDRYDAHLTIKL